MFSCCENCELKYIDENGIIDLYSPYLENIKLECERIQYSDLNDSLKQLLIKNILDKICKCDCHIINSGVIH